MPVTFSDRPETDRPLGSNPIVEFWEALDYWQAMRFREVTAKRDLVDAIRRARAAGSTWTAIAADCGVTIPTIHYWLANN